MVIDFSNINLGEQPTLILKNVAGTALGVLGFAKNVSLDLKYNEMSEITFELPKYVDGILCPNYDSVCGLTIIELYNVGQFILVNPKEVGDGIKTEKQCTGYSLEYEFNAKKITLEKGTYNFWNPLASDNTIIALILELMPSWSVGDIDASLVGRYRTFEENNVSVYDFIKGNCQRSYECIFVFNTMDRTIDVVDAYASVGTSPIYISTGNLAKEIEIEEITDDIITRIDVNGADGVTIRDVNPDGTNKIINLDYYMTATNVGTTIVGKYNAWKATYVANQTPYYNLSVEYAVETARYTTENAVLTDLNNEMVSLENQQAVTIQSIAEGLMVQADLDEVNVLIAAKEAEIAAQQILLTAISSGLSTLYSQLQAIVTACNFENSFTEEEYLIVDRYIKDGDVTDDGFVFNETNYYNSEDTSETLSSGTFDIINGIIVHTVTVSGNDMYDITGGSLTIGGLSGADVIKAVIEVKTDNSFIISAYLAAGEIDSVAYDKGCLSITGTSTGFDSNIVDDAGTWASVDFSTAHFYFTLNTNEYERRSVAWDLYEYGQNLLNVYASPTYSFKVNSANFLALSDFVSFKNNLTMGAKVYLDVSEGSVLEPIVIGARFSYKDLKELTLEFSNEYKTHDKTFKMVSLLEQSISMGKNVDSNKYSYASFVTSGANSSVAEFISSVLDVSKNAIMSSSGQALTWNDAGIRMRKWTDSGHTAYEPEQSWISNNSYMMTDDAWATAKIAIGKFEDDNLGTCYGIVAPYIVGTILAGTNLVIESEKQDGGIAVFKIDSSGCFLYNSEFNIVGDNTHVFISPDLGIALGDYPVYTIVGDTAVVDEDNARFWVDIYGNVHIKGNITATATDTVSFTTDNFTIYNANGNNMMHITAEDPETGEPGGVLELGEDGYPVRFSGSFILPTQNGGFGDAEHQMRWLTTIPSDSLGNNGDIAVIYNTDSGTYSDISPTIGSYETATRFGRSRIWNYERITGYRAVGNTDSTLGGSYWSFTTPSAGLSGFTLQFVEAKYIGVWYGWNLDLPITVEVYSSLSSTTPLATTSFIPNNNATLMSVGLSFSSPLSGSTTYYIAMYDSTASYNKSRALIQNSTVLIPGQSGVSYNGIYIKTDGAYEKSDALSYTEVVIHETDASAHSTLFDAKVPTTRTVNGHALSSDVTVTVSDIGAVPTTRTINSHALSSNITLSNTDVGAAATAHTHGDITSDGKIGSTPAQFVTTGTAGAITAISGSSARVYLRIFTSDTEPGGPEDGDLWFPAAT